MADITTDQIKTLDVAGKVIVITSPEAERGDANQLAHYLRKSGATLVIMMPSGVSLDALDEEMMRSHGWVRAPK